MKLRILITSLGCLFVAATAHAQSSSLYKQEAQTAPATTATTEKSAPIRLQKGSWTYIPPPQVQEVRVNDLVYVRVNIGSEVLSEGDAEVRKTGLYNAVLSDWIKLVGLRAIKPAEQADGDPKVAGSLTQRRKAESSVETRDSLEFDIQARIIDIRPNGNLILEARKNVSNNEEHWEFSLGGEIRPQDIGVGNTVLSRNIADLKIDKRERGQVRDGYKRGWFLKWFDPVMDPF